MIEENPLEQGCLVVAMDGFIFKGNFRLKQPPRFIIREVGRCDWHAEGCGSFLYQPSES